MKIKLRYVFDFTPIGILGEDDFIAKIKNYPNSALVFLFDEQIEHIVQHFSKKNFRYINGENFGFGDLLVYQLSSGKPFLIVSAYNLENFGGEIESSQPEELKK